MSYKIKESLRRRLKMSAEKAEKTSFQPKTLKHCLLERWELLLEDLDPFDSWLTSRDPVVGSSFGVDTLKISVNVP